MGSVHREPGLQHVYHIQQLTDHEATAFVYKRVGTFQLIELQREEPLLNPFQANWVPIITRQGHAGAIRSFNLPDPLPPSARFGFTRRGLG